MKNKLYFFAGLLVGLLLVVLNPSLETHQDEIREQYKKEHEIAGSLGLGFLKSKSVSYDTYGVFSVTYVGDTFTSFGILGMVFVEDVKIEGDS